MSYNTTLYINLTGTFLPVLTGAFRIKLLDKASFIFYVLLVLSLVTECQCAAKNVKFAAFPIKFAAFLISIRPNHFAKWQKEFYQMTF